MQDLQPVIQAISQFLFAVILTLVPILIRYYAPIVKTWIAAKAKDAQWGLVINAALDIVKQVEQLKKTGLIADNATAKKWAVQALGEWLLSRGINLPIDNLATAIESAVNDLPHEECLEEWDEEDAEGAQQ